MSGQPTCPECARPLPRSGPEGVCPICSLRGALNPSNESDELRAGSDVASLCPSAHSPMRFGDYELLELLAHGGMGVVYKARQIKLNQVVALKMMQAGVLASRSQIKRFQEEAAAIANLQHPGIVAIHQIGCHEGQHYFSMEYVPGPTLAEVLNNGPLLPSRAAVYIRKVALALQYAHEHGILHRDLKPSNLILDEKDSPRIADFGLAKRISDRRQVFSNDCLASDVQVPGSPNYLPPEQADPKRGPLGPPSDVYALGSVLYHLLTGRPPFQADSLSSLLRQVIETDPVSPKLINPSVPRDLEKICLKCLEKQPQRRYPTAQALAEELERFLNNQPVHALPVSRQKALRPLLRRVVKGAMVSALFIACLAGATYMVRQWHRSKAGL